eukprot:gene617-2048_t
MSSTKSRGFLLIKAGQGSGKTQHGFAWDSDAESTFEAFVRVEIRGGAHSVKAQTAKAALDGETITWGEEMRLELLNGSNELRLMLCREKFLGQKKGTAVISACGIYVNDILEAAPIDKYFELFKPSGGGEGGLIRVTMRHEKGLSELDSAGASAGDKATQDGQTTENKKGGK